MVSLSINLKNKQIYLALMSHIRFLERKDIHKIEYILNVGLILERGHILYTNESPADKCEIIVSIINNSGSRRKIMANVGPIQTPNGIEWQPNKVYSQTPYSGSLVFGSLEGKVIEKLEELYRKCGDGSITAEQYDSYARIVNKCREDLSKVDPVRLQLGAALGGTLVGVFYEPGFGPSVVGMGLGGVVASGMIYLRERWELLHNSHEIEKLRKLL